MTVIHRYIVETFLKYFAIVLIMVVLVYLAIDFFSRIDRFLASPVSGYNTALYFLYKIPLIVSQITPIAVLLAVLIVFGLMSRNNEIIALKSSGISVFYLLKPIVVIGILASVALFVFSEVVVPVSIARSNEIDSQRRGDRPGLSSFREDVWIRHSEGLAHARYVRPREDALFGVSLYFLDEDYRLTHRIDAQRAEYEDGKWVFFESMIQKLEEPGHGIRVEYSDRAEFALDLEPSDFRRVVAKSNEMGFLGLYRYIQRVEREGYHATEYRVDFHGKIAYPLICLIIALMGAAIALRGNTRDSMAANFAYGIVVAFAYWSVHSFSLSMGYGGVVPPFMAAWIANLLFGMGMMLLLLYLE